MSGATEFRQFAEELIAEFKAEGLARDVTLIKSGTTLYDATQPWLGPKEAYTTGEVTPDPAGPAVEATGVAAFLPFTEDDDEEALKRGSTRCLLAASATLLADGTEADVRGFQGLRDGDKLWHVERVLDYAPGPLSILWDLEVRQA